MHKLFNNISGITPYRSGTASCRRDLRLVLMMEQLRPAFGEVSSWDPGLTRSRLVH
ncbi:MAG: hypothetical protein SPI16_04605 [Porphyromonas sp.]|uniref:hypothetical protein n=1 Tax=Porphyromonas sp. TaxID=1924944 RepID=UPI002A91FD02|nr:hypothetical protein [Porphyromonas sp.]MDD7468870.1 hypothetical protein [Bacteroidales bacterium]MDY6102315.1 hypothetical protein [Porphyromonas sp.]